MKDNIKLRTRVAYGLNKFYLRYGRGNGLLSFIVQIFQHIFFLGGLSYLTNKWFGVELPAWILIGISLGYVVVCYEIGYLDEKVGFWKMQQDYIARDLTPFFDKMDKKIDNINNAIQRPDKE